MNRSARGARAIHVSEDIVPIAEFKAHLSEMVRGLPVRGRPVIVTQNGRPAAVILSPAEFDRLSYHARFVAAVNEGLEDVEKARVLSRDELTKIIDERYGPLPKGKPRRR